MLATITKSETAHSDTRNLFYTGLRKTQWSKCQDHAKAGSGRAILVAATIALPKWNTRLYMAVRAMATI